MPAFYRAPTVIFVISLILLFSSKISESEEIELDGEHYKILTVDNIKDDASLSIFRFRYDRIEHKDSLVAVFFSYAGGCYFSLTERNKPSTLHNLGAAPYYMFSDLNPSMFELGISGYLTGATDKATINQAEAECIEASNLGKALTEFPMFLAVGYLRQEIKSFPHYGHPYVEVKEIHFVGEFTESFFVPGEATKALGKIALKLMIKGKSK